MDWHPGLCRPAKRGGARTTDQEQSALFSAFRALLAVVRRRAMLKVRRGISPGSAFLRLLPLSRLPPPRPAWRHAPNSCRVQAGRGLPSPGDAMEQGGMKNSGRLAAANGLPVPVSVHPAPIRRRKRLPRRKRSKPSRQQDRESKSHGIFRCYGIFCRLGV